MIHPSQYHFGTMNLQLKNPVSQSHLWLDNGPCTPIRGEHTLLLVPHYNCLDINLNNVKRGMKILKLVTDKYFSNLRLSFQIFGVLVKRNIYITKTLSQRKDYLYKNIEENTSLLIKALKVQCRVQRNELFY